MGVLHVANTVEGVGRGDMASFDGRVGTHEERAVVGFDDRGAEEDFFAFTSLRVDAVESDIAEELTV